VDGSPKEPLPPLRKSLRRTQPPPHFRVPHPHPAAASPDVRRHAITHGAHGCTAGGRDGARTAPSARVATAIAAQRELGLWRCSCTTSHTAGSRATWATGAEGTKTRVTGLLACARAAADTRAPAFPLSDSKRRRHRLQDQSRVDQSRARWYADASAREAPGEAARGNEAHSQGVPSLLLSGTARNFPR
jgi:hypothetical protein